jgi:hypothetical protein
MVNQGRICTGEDVCQVGGQRHSLTLATLKMEALRPPKHWPTAWFYSPKDSNLHSYPCYFLFICSKSIALQ